MNGTEVRRRRWEDTALAVLSYPANLALAGVAAFILSLGVVTWLSAAVAAGRALHRWQEHGDDAVFTQTFREMAATWRRTWLLSVVATVLAAMVLVNLLFLGTRESPAAFLLATAMLPVAGALLLLALMLPAAASRDRDATTAQWLRAVVALGAQRPISSLVLLSIVAAFGLTCVLLPTIVPFLGISLPVWLALVATGNGAGTAADQREHPARRRLRPEGRLRRAPSA
ncbi:hypothetical protein [Phytoactinopolyspora halotolerans]|uniref:DUF624 domain-containing protein n=1 Tax=Phytoactinopolyspora halotolerans TaxID=1981512 RepID=A0A6L9SBB4_9ACTN|nr:hypothetical protein [Phytoactinopolyspora halotolerans]NEE01914.1 hypothetical protein [Phytoactinopolyspora halotolerans]